MIQAEQSTLPPEDDAAAGRVMRLVREGYRLLAELHDAIGEAAPDAADGQEHAARATRELAAVQRIFERRGTGR